MCILSCVGCGVSTHLWRLEMPVTVGWLAGWRGPQNCNDYIYNIYFRFLKALRDSPMCINKLKVTTYFICELAGRQSLLSFFFISSSMLSAPPQPFDAKPCLTLRNKYKLQFFFFFLGKQRGKLYYIKSAVTTRVARPYKTALASLDKTSIIPKGLM